MATTDGAGAVGAAGLTDAQQEAMRGAVPEAMLSTPYLAWLDLRFERYAPDDVTMRLPFRPELTNDGARYHGGVVAAVLDTTGAAAAWSNHDFSRGARASTVSMSVQYAGAAKESDLLCTARVVRRVKELIFTEITASDTAGNPVAHAVQTYRIT